jgi:hypothetical protein
MNESHRAGDNVEALYRAQNWLAPMLFGRE